MAWTRFGKKKDMPGGLWIKCERCGAMLFRKDFESKLRVCGTCGHHFTMPARERIALIADEGTFVEIHRDMKSKDRLHFIDRVPYSEKLKATQKKTGESEAVIIGTCTIKDLPVVIAVMNFAFLGGSMGAVVGEKVSLAIEKAQELGVPVLLFACSGGARMHEGPLSLMQMAKTCAALSRFNATGGFSISILTHPTTGGVTASFASVCDVLLAEPGALIGFAGPRVIATTIKKELPKGFQRSEFLLDAGQIDRIVRRDRMRDELARLVAYATGKDAAAAYTPQRNGDKSPTSNGQPEGKPGDKATEKAKRARAKEKKKKVK